MKIRRGVFFWFPFDSSGSPWDPFGHPLGSCGSLWSAIGLPLAGLWGPSGHPGPYGAQLGFIKITYDYRQEGLQLYVKTYGSRREG